MVFSDSTNKSGIVDKVRFLTKTTAETYHINDITREVNNALDEYFVLAMNANNKNWEIDDITYTDYAVAGTNLVSGQNDYLMPTGLVEIQRVFIRDVNGNLLPLTPVDQSEYSNALDQIFETSGQPIVYEKKADGIFVYPSPDYNYTNGLQIEYQRVANYFLTTDTTKKPGIPDIHHDYLTLNPVSNYNIKEGKDIKNDFYKIKQDKEDSIKRYWSKRGKDKAVRMIPVYHSPE